MSDDALLPILIELKTVSQVLNIGFESGEQFSLNSEFLRVHSPSAEVRGHGVGQAKLQTGKRQIKILKIEPVGHYALKITFDDGHHSGLYTWAYLYYLGQNQTSLWQSYLDALAAAGASRES